MELKSVGASLHVIVLCPSVAEPVIECVPVDDCASPEEVVGALGDLALSAAVGVHAGVVEVGPDEHVLVRGQRERVGLPRAVVVLTLIVASLVGVTQVVHLEVAERGDERRRVNEEIPVVRVCIGNLRLICSSPPSSVAITPRPSVFILSPRIPDPK